MGAKSYQRASDQGKAEMLADAVSFGEDVAKREMLTARGVEYKSSAWEKAYAITRNGGKHGETVPLRFRRRRFPRARSGRRRGKPLRPTPPCGRPSSRMDG